MKIDDEDLRNLFREYLRDRIPISRINCPPFEKFIDLIDGHCENVQKEDLIVHIAQCGPCAEEFILLRAIRKQESDLVHEIEETSPKTPSKIRPRTGFYSMPGFLRYASIIIGICTFFGLGIFGRFRFAGARAHRNEIRGSNAISLNLEKPRRTLTPPHLLTFRWEGSSNFISYRLEIFDEALFPIVTMPDLIAQEYSLPELISKNIPQAGSWSWMVTARFRNGEEISSNLQRLSLND